MEDGANVRSEVSVLDRVTWVRKKEFFSKLKQKSSLPQLYNTTAAIFEAIGDPLLKYLLLIY